MPAGQVAGICQLEGSRFVDIKSRYIKWRGEIKTNFSIFGEVIHIHKSQRFPFDCFDP